MPPLPLIVPIGSYTEVAGTGASFSASGNVALCANVQQSISLSLHAPGGPADPWTIHNQLSVVGGDIQAELTVQEPGPGAIHNIATILNPTDSDYFAPIAFSMTQGPWRLGAQHVFGFAPPDSGLPDGAAELNTLQYQWFSDEATLFSETVAGFPVNIYANRLDGAPGTQSVWAWYPAHSPTAKDQHGIPGQFEISAVAFAPVNFPAAHFTGVTAFGSLVETAGLDDLFSSPFTSSEWRAVGAGAFDWVPATNARRWAPYWAPGISLTYDVGVKDYGGTNATLTVRDTWVTDGETFHAIPKTPSAASIPVNASTAYSTAFSTNFDRPSKNPPVTVLQVTSGAPQTNPLWDSGDTVFVFDQASPVSGATSYTPITVTHKGAIEIDRTDGSRPSHWTVVQNGTVTENAGDTTFVNTGGLAIWQRNYLTHWRAYLAGAPDGDPDPFSILRHNYYPISFPGGEDVWWWNSYSFLKLTVNSPGATTLRIQIDGVLLIVNRMRGFGFTSNTVSERRIYDVPLTAGTHDYYVDLSFPVSFRSSVGGMLPLWRPRVDSVQVKIPAAGTYVVSTMALTRRDSYANQTKVAFTSPSFFDPDWCCVYTRVDGEGTNALTYPDWTRKGFESLQEVGGSLRYADFDAQAIFSAREMWQQVLRVEGFGFSYDDAPRAAFLRDVYGINLVPPFSEPSVFALEQTSGVAWAGAGDAHAFSPPHALRIGKIGLVPGISLTVKPRKRIGGGIEAVGTSSPGTRASAGQNANVRDQNNVVIATVTTDARGRLHYEPLKPSIDPAVKFTLGSTYTGIGTRETSHDFAVATTAAAGSSPFNLTTRFGEYFESYVRSGDVWFKASDLPTPPFRADLEVTTSADCSEPRFCVVPRRRHFLCYTRPAGIFERTSDDDGITWNTESASFAGAKHPDIVCSARSEILRAAYLAGKITANFQGPGDASPSVSFNFKNAAAADLLVQDDSFRIAWEPRGIWWLHALIQGDANPSLWWSADEGATWTLWGSTFSGSRPGIVIGFEGTFLLWTYSAGTIRTAYMSPGNATLQGPVTLLDAAGANWAVADDAVSFALAREAARRWVMVGVFNAEGTISTWWSSDEAISEARFS